MTDTPDSDAPAGQPGTGNEPMAAGLDDDVEAEAEAPTGGDAADADDDATADVVDLDDLPPPPVGGLRAPAGSVEAERDDFRDALLRVKADFENYKKRVSKEHADRVARAAEGLVSQLLPVLDACEAAVAQGEAAIEPIAKNLLDVLTKEGLEAMDDVGAAFDPVRHEAVMHEEGDDDEQVVAAALRTGYLWKGRVVRPAMVKVRG